MGYCIFKTWDDDFWELLLPEDGRLYTICLTFRQLKLMIYHSFRYEIEFREQSAIKQLIRTSIVRCKFMLGTFKLKLILKEIYLKSKTTYPATHIAVCI